MAREWNEVLLWALAEELSERIDAIREEKERESPRQNRSASAERSDNIIDASARFAPRR